MKWTVLGGSGFVGSAVLHALSTVGITAVSLAAPRLESHARTVPELEREADRLKSIVEELAGSFRGSDVVINAAGLAAPRSIESPALTGANALLPAILARACADAGVSRLVHLSSAAVQGHRPVLDESTATEPFSPYSRSKALGEQVLAHLRAGGSKGGGSDVVIVRATSVQGPGRPTTTALARLAASPLATVASPGNAPSPVTSIDSLAALVLAVGQHEGPVPPIVLQPWERMTVRTVLEAAGGTPLILPAGMCRLILKVGYGVSGVLRERLHGSIRRVELMWFGQDQVSGWAAESGVALPGRVGSILEAAGARRRQ